MLNSLVAVVLGNAVVAALLAIVVVLLARVWHKPALLHGLWVVVLLKLITPPLLSIPVPVDLPAFVQEESPQEPAVQAMSRPAEALAPPEQVSRPTAQPLLLDPPETIVIDGSEDVAELVPLPANQIGVLVQPRNRTAPGSVGSAAAPPSQSAMIPIDQPAPTALPAASPINQPPAERVASPSKSVPWFTWKTLVLFAFIAWPLGAAVVVFLSVRQIVRFERSLRHAEPAPEAVVNWVRRLAREMGISRPPAVWLCPGSLSPMLWGLGRRPRLLFPKELLNRLNHEATETLILHELAHLRRGDHWVRLLELICQCVYWWHPVVWWGRKHLRIVEEECCDAWVVEQCQGGRVYARALIATVDFLSERRCVIPPAASGIGNLEFLKRRLTMIMQGGVSARLAGLPRLLVLTLAVTCLSVLPRIVERTALAQAEEQPAEPTAEPATAAKPADEPSATDESAAPEPKASAPLAPEPIEFEKTPRGYPLAQIEVRDLAFSPDGRLLAAGYGKWDTTGEVVIYEFSTKRVLKKFPFAKGVASVVFSGDGKYLAASVWNNVVQIWDTETWALVADKVTGSNVARVAFSPDGKYLASGNEAGELKLWTVGQWDQERIITGDLFRFQKVAFSPDSKLLCAVGGSFTDPRFGRGLVFEVETGKQIAKIESTGAVMASAAFSPDGKELATGEYATALRFWEPATGKAISVIEIGGTMDTLEYTKDGTLVGPSYAGTVHLIKNRAVVRSFTGHVGRSYTARVSPDGKTLVSGGIDALIRIWNPETGVPTGTMRPNEALEDTQEAVLAIAHSPNGRFAATTHEDGTVRLREAESGEFIRLLKGHQDVVGTVAFSPDSQTLATGSYDQTVKLWNVDTGEAIRTLKGHTNWVFSLAFSPDGQTLASSGYDKTVRLWNVQRGETKAVLEGHSAAVRSLAFSPNGEQLVSGSSDRSLRIWDLASRETLHELKGHTGAVRAVAYSPDGSRIASASEDKTIRFWNPNTGESLQELKGHTGMVWCLAFSPRGRTLASGGFDNTIRLWSGNTGAALQTLSGHKDVVTSLSYSPDGTSLVTGSYDKSLKRWAAIEAPTPALADLHIGGNSTTPVVRFAAFLPQGTRMITGNQHRSIRLWDLETGRVIKTVLQPHSISNGVLSPDGKILATTDFGGQTYFWNTETLEMIATLQTGQVEGMFVAFSPDGQWLATCGWNGDLKIWNVETREKITEFPKQEMPIGGLAFSPDGKLLATTTGDWKDDKKPGKVKLWDTATWKEIANIEGSPLKMRRVIFNPSGNTLVVCGPQPELLVYDVPNRKLAARIPIGTGISDAAFLPDGRTVVLGGYDGRVELWNLDTKKRLVNYEGHRAGEVKNHYVFDVAVSPDGSVVASTSADGHVKLWPTSALPPILSLASWDVPKAEPMSVAFSPDGQRSALTTTKKIIEIRETASGKTLLTIENLNTTCVHVQFSPDGQTLAGAMQGGNVYLWDAETGEEQRTLEAHPGGARRAVFSPDGQWLATCGWDETAAVWNVADGSPRYRLEKQGLALSDVAFSPEGKLLATATGSWKDWRKPGSITFWMAEDGKKIADLGSHEAEIKGIAFDAGGHFFISYGGNGAKLWSRNDRKLIRGIGQGTTITAAAFSPDGGTLFTGDRSGLMLVYDVTTGKVKRTLDGHEALVYSVAASGDGTLLASASKDGAVKFWPAARIPALQPLRQIPDDPEQLFDVAYSPDGRWLAVAGKDKIITLRDAGTLEVVREIPGHNGVVFRVVFTPDSQSLLSASTDGTVRLWNVADGKELVKWKAHGEKLEMVRSLALSADGQLVAAGNWAGETRLWNLETKQLLHQLPKQVLAVGGLAFSPDGKLLATCTGNWKEPNVNGQLKLWNALTGEEVATLEGHPGDIKGVLFTKDGQTLISHGKDVTVRFWDVATRRLVRTQDYEQGVGSMALRDDGLLALAFYGGGVGLTDLQGGGLITHTRGHSHFPCATAFSPSGTRLATVCHNGYLKVWPTQIPALAIQQLPAKDSQNLASLAEKIRDWKPLVLQSRPNQTAQRIKQLTPHGDKIWFAVYSPDGTILATGGSDKTVKLWNAKTFEPLRTLTGHQDFTTYAAFSPDGQKLATVALNNDKTVRLWDVATGKTLAVASGHQQGCRRVAFSPDGKQIASASEDGTVRLWDGNTLALKLSMKLDLNAYSVAFSPDGKLLAVGTGNWREKKNGQISLWNPETGARVKTLENSDGVVFHLQFLKDSRHLLASNEKVDVSIWNVESGQVEETYRGEGRTRWVEISRDEQRIVASHSLGMVTLWNRHDSQPNLGFKASEGFIHAATFSPNGKQLVVADEASTLSVWELRDAPASQVAETAKASP